MKLIKILTVAALVVSFSSSSFAATKCRAQQLSLKAAQVGAYKAERKEALLQKKYDRYDMSGGTFDQLANSVERAERSYESSYTRISAQIARVQGIQKEIEKNTDGRIISSVVCFLFCGSKNPIRDAKNEADRQIKMRALKQKYFLQEKAYARNLERLQNSFQTKQQRLADKKVKLQGDQAATLAALNTAKAASRTADALVEQKQALLEACVAAS